MARSLVWYVLLLATGLWSSRAPASSAQSQAPVEVRYTFALVGVSLSEALARLMDETELSLVYETELTEGRVTFCRAQRATADELLACILRGTGVDYIRLSSGTYVLIADPRQEPQYASLLGQVVDAETGVPLADANVLLSGEDVGTATNPHGRFAFPAVLPGTHQLIVTHVSYYAVSDTVNVGPAEDGQILISMRPRIVLSAPVVVSGFHERLPAGKLEAENITAGMLTGHNQGGIPDVVQTLDDVTGVHLGTALSDVHLQGGASNEQPFLLDGVPVFVPISNGGVVGPFSPFAVEQITVRKAGFGASHGSGLSGVIEMEHHLASPEGSQLTAQVDPASLNARWNGRAKATSHFEAAWMVALRHSLWDQLAPQRLTTLFRRWATPDRILYEMVRRQLAPSEPAHWPGTLSDGALEVGFDDVHLASRIQIGALRSLHASFYRGTGAFGIDDVGPASGSGAQDLSEDVFEDAYNWHNRTAQLRYEWVQSRRLFLNVGAWATTYELNHPISLGGSVSREALSDEFNLIAEVGVRVGTDLAASARHYISGAVDATHTDSEFALSLDPFGTTPAGPDDIRPVRWRIAAFLEDRFFLNRRTTLTLGTRVTYIPAMQRVFGEPRVALRYDREMRGRRSWAAHLAAGVYRQYLHAFDVATYNVTSLLPRMRFWLPVGVDQRPPEAYHVVAGLLYRPVRRWQFTAEAYYKHQPHLLVLNYGDRAAARTGAVIRSANGTAYGATISAAYEGTRFQVDGWYDYAVARRRVANRFGGAVMPVPWSAPHRIHLALEIRPQSHWKATVRWHGIFGRSWGFRQAYYDFLEPYPATRSLPPFDLSEPDSHRLPVFSQLDVTVSYERRVFGVGVEGSLSVINVLDRKNVIDWSLQADGSTRTYRRDPRRAIPFFPAFSLRLSL